MKQFHLLLLAVFTLQITQAQIVNIPDANFKNALINMQCVDTDGDNIADSDADTNDDGEIQVSEAEAVTYLRVRGAFPRITSLDGIEYFVNLTHLICGYTDITELDVSQNTNLTSLNCENSQLTSLDLSLNTNITYLVCDNNQLTNLNLGQNNIGFLLCENNQLTSLDVTNCNDLFVLSCYDNQLTSLDVTLNPDLLRLLCQNNQLTTLDVSQNSLLDNLFIYNNQLNTIDVSQNTNLEILNCSNNQLATLDISQNSFLESLWCDNNQLTELDTANNPSLRYLHCSSNQLMTLNLDQNINLIRLICSDNQITTLDVSMNSELRFFDCSDNLLTTLDVSQNFNLGEGVNYWPPPYSYQPYLSCVNNQIETLFLKNGVRLIGNDIDFDLNPNLVYICADEINMSWINQSLDFHGGYDDVVVNSYCSFSPGGVYFTVQGQSFIDANINGCDTNDNLYTGLTLNISNGSLYNTIIPNSSGDYSIFVQDGTHTITPQLENPTYFTVSPSSITVEFPTDTSPFTQDFCVTPNGAFNDLEITIIPLNQARPGFNANYKLVYKNKGTTTLSGTVDFMFQDELMDLVSASPIADTQTINNLSWDYTNLEPFESREILVSMNLNTPTETPPLNGNDELGFTATINPVAGDETPNDNSISIKQIVVNSYDPNDKTCLEGTTITPEMVGKDVHYLIRFENTGTASAINVVVKDEIDLSKYDISTLFITDASHEMVTRIKDGNVVEFIFENINLPFDDANNDGYIAFKIKTLNTLVEGDTFENDAEIYFDFNFPIITNNYVTTVQEPLSIQEFGLTNFNLYPNPTKDILNIKGTEAIKSVSIYDISGRVINAVSVIGNQNEITVDTNKLNSGTYFVKITTETGEGVRKVVKQ